MTDSMTDDDAELVALIDNELDENRKSALLARLETDERLRARYEALRETRAPIAASFDALLEKAPIERLRARLPVDSGAQAPPGRFAGVALRELAAGIVIGLLIAGAAAWAALSLAPLTEKEDWHSAVVEYADLYTNETFSPLNPDRFACRRSNCSAVGARVGANLTPGAGGAPRPAVHGGVHALLRGLAVGRDRLCRPPKGRRSCFASTPVMRRTPRWARSGAAICRSRFGRAADAAIW